MFRPTPWLAIAVALLGCPSAETDDDDSAASPDDDDSTPEPTEGTLAVSFNINEIRAGQMDEPAVGPFWGTIYDTDDVLGTGPKDDAREYGSIYVEVVDLTDGTFTSPVLHTTALLPTTWVTIFGFMDSDGNSVEDDRSPDDADPVTLPNQNEFLVVAGEETAAEVHFGLLQ